jgi:hypothetical protein
MGLVEASYARAKRERLAHCDCTAPPPRHSSVADRGITDASDAASGKNCRTRQIRSGELTSGVMTRAKKFFDLMGQTNPIAGIWFAWLRRQFIHRCRTYAH